MYLAAHFFFPCLNLEYLNAADRLRSKEGELLGEVNMKEDSLARCCQSCAPVRTADMYYQQQEDKQEETCHINLTSNTG